MHVAVQSRAVTAQAGPAWSTAAAFAVLVAASAVTTVVSNRSLLTAQVLTQVLPARANVDPIMAMIHRIQFVSVVASPVVWGGRLLFLALLVQLMCLLDSVELPFAQAFRAVTVASYASVLAAATRLGFLLFAVGVAHIDAHALQIVPTSVASLVMAPDDPRRLLYECLSRVSLWELAWVGLLAAMLTTSARVPRRQAALIAAMTWGLTAAAGIGLAVLTGAAG